MAEKKGIISRLKQFISCSTVSGEGNHDEGSVYVVSVLLLNWQVERTLKGTRVTYPHQLFINNEFVDASDGGTFETICPYDEQVSVCVCVVI